MQTEKQPAGTAAAAVYRALSLHAGFLTTSELQSETGLSTSAINRAVHVLNCVKSSRIIKKRAVTVYALTPGVPNSDELIKRVQADHTAHARALANRHRGDPFAQLAWCSNAPAVLARPAH